MRCPSENSSHSIERIEPVIHHNRIAVGRIAVQQLDNQVVAGPAQPDIAEADALAESKRVLAPFGMAVDHIAVRRLPVGADEVAVNRFDR